LNSIGGIPSGKPVERGDHSMNNDWGTQGYVFWNEGAILCKVQQCTGIFEENYGNRFTKNTAKEITNERAFYNRPLCLTISIFNWNIFVAF
jgi:hypothetical protein